MSAPSSLAHTRCSLFLKMNCLRNSSISIINNAYWINWEAIDTGLSSLQGSLTKALVKRRFLLPRMGSCHMLSFSSLGKLAVFNQSHLFWSFSSTLEVRETQGLGTNRDELVQAHPSTRRKTLVHTPLQEWMTTVKVTKTLWSDGNTTYHYETGKPRPLWKAN